MSTVSTCTQTNICTAFNFVFWDRDVVSIQKLFYRRVYILKYIAIKQQCTPPKSENQISLLHCVHFWRNVDACSSYVSDLFLCSHTNVCFRCVKKVKTENGMAAMQMDLNPADLNSYSRWSFTVIKRKQFFLFYTET